MCYPPQYADLRDSSSSHRLQYSFHRDRLISSWLSSPSHGRWQLIQRMWGCTHHRQDRLYYLCTHAPLEIRDYYSIARGCALSAVLFLYFAPCTNIARAAQDYAIREARELEGRAFLTYTLEIAFVHGRSPRRHSLNQVCVCVYVCPESPVLSLALDAITLQPLLSFTHGLPHLKMPHSTGKSNFGLH